MPAPTETDDLVGQVIDDRYEVIDRLGAGGVGVVYRAKRVKLGRMVALKVLHKALVEEEGFVARFQREAVAMSRLYHPHCVGVIDFGMFDGRPYLVLEYLPGKTVAELVDAGGPFAPTRAIAVALQLLDTLEHFHRHHVLHRDLKSENVMLVESAGSTEFVKVLDFGMAKILQGPGADSQLSQLGIIPGTPSAMAPEQIQQLPPDPRLDIYAVGILLYEMIVGRRPFRDADMATVIRMQLSATPEAPSTVLGPGVISPELESDILKALQKDRFDRFGSAEDMAAALRKTPEGRAAVATLPTAASLAPPPALAAVSSRKLWIAGGVLAIAAVGVGVGIGLSTNTVALSAVLAPPVLERPAPKTPPPAPVPELWVAHRDLAVTYAARGQLDDAWHEVEAAVREDARSAGADPALADTAVASLATADSDPALVAQAFRENPRLVEELVKATTTAGAPRLRQKALTALDKLGAADQADAVAIRILDLQEATTCPKMKASYKALRGEKDPRVKKLISALRSKSRRDPLVKCLGRELRRR